MAANLQPVDHSPRQSAQAERVAVRVEQHPDVMLRLAVGKNCALINRPCCRGIQICDTDVEVLRGSLAPGGTRPHGALIVLVELEVEADSSIALQRRALSPPILGRLAGPGRIFGNDSPAEQPRIELREFTWMSRGDRHGPNRHLWIGHEWIVSIPPLNRNGEYSRVPMTSGHVSQPTPMASD